MQNMRMSMAYCTPKKDAVNNRYLLAYLDIKTENDRWCYPLPSATCDVVVDKEYIFVASHGGLMALSKKDNAPNRLLWRVDKKFMFPQITVKDSFVIVENMYKKRYGFDVQTGKPRDIE